MECQILFPLSANVDEAPNVYGLPEGESKKPVFQQVLGFLRRLVSGQVCGARYQLMPVRQKLLGHKRRILQVRVDTEGQVDAFRDLIDNPVSDEHLDTDIGIGRLKRPKKRRKKRIRDAGWRGETQFA